MLTTAADTMASEINLGGHADSLIPHTPEEGEWSESRELLQLQQISGNCLVRRGGMGALMTDGGQTLMTVSRYTEMMRCVCTASFL